MMMSIMLCIVVACVSALTSKSKISLFSFFQMVLPENQENRGGKEASVAGK
jgi:hypothetical protein